LRAHGRRIKMSNPNIVIESNLSSDNKVILFPSNYTPPDKTLAIKSALNYAVLRLTQHSDREAINVIRRKLIGVTSVPTMETIKDIAGIYERINNG